MSLLWEFKVRNVDVRSKYLWVEVQIFERQSELRLDRPKNAQPKKVYACYQTRTDTWCGVRRSHGCIGSIRLALSRKIEVFAMHESIHAAFDLSRYRSRWPIGDEGEREEFIAYTADRIFDQIRKRLREHGGGSKNGR